MTPILSNVRLLLCSMLVWLVVGGGFAKLLFVSDMAAWPNALFFAIPVSLVYGFVVSSAYYVCRSLPFKRRHFFMVCTVFGATAIISGSLWLGVCQLWNYLGISLGEPWAGIALTQRLSMLILGVGSFLYLLSILAHDVLIAFENVRAADRREAASQVLARDAELQVLRTQINPHFLFNSLNSISALTTIDPAGARSMTIELANFFRQTLALSEKNRITLSEEIALCNNFLAIEKIRFGKKLQVTMEIDPAYVSATLGGERHQTWHPRSGRWRHHCHQGPGARPMAAYRHTKPHRPTSVGQGWQRHRAKKFTGALRQYLWRQGQVNVCKNTGSICR